MFQRILVPLDGSPAAEQVIPLAARIARSAGGSVTFLYVIPPVLPEDRETGRALERRRLVEKETQALLEASAYLSSVLATYTEELTGASPEIEVAFGRTAPLLASTVRCTQADLVVMRSHRGIRLGQWGRASVAEQAIHQPIGALLILKEPGMERQPDRMHPLRMVVPLDGSLFAEMALEPALHLLVQLSLLGYLSSEMHLVRVVAEHGEEYQQAERYLQAITKRLRTQFRVGENCLLTSSVVVGETIPEAILAQVNTTGFAPLLALATHGREGMERLIWGSVTERVLDAAPCPLLIVHPGSAVGKPASQRQVAGSRR